MLDLLRVGLPLLVWPLIGLSWPTWVLFGLDVGSLFGLLGIGSLFGLFGLLGLSGLGLLGDLPLGFLGVLGLIFVLKTSESEPSSRWVSGSDD